MSATHVCSHCRRWIDSTGKYAPCDRPTTGPGISHGTCLACGALWLLNGGLSVRNDWTRRLAEQVLELQSHVENREGGKKA